MAQNLVDLAQVRAAWTRRYGAAAARAMMARDMGAAYDSTRGLGYGSRRGARDQEQEQEGGEGGNDPIQKIKTFIMNRLSPEDQQRLKQMVAAINNGGEGEEGESPFSAGGPREGEDDPSRFKGQPLAGGRMAGDSRGASYLDYFEMNAAVDISDYGGGRTR